MNPIELEKLAVGVPGLDKFAAGFQSIPGLLKLFGPGVAVAGQQQQQQGGAGLLGGIQSPTGGGLLPGGMSQADLMRYLMMMGGR